jgi:hypothetical protein
VLRLRIDQRIPDNGIITSGETPSGMRIALRKSRSVLTGGQALNAVFVLNQETYGLLDQIRLKSRRLHGELKYFNYSDHFVKTCNKISSSLHLQ